MFEEQEVKIIKKENLHSEVQTVIDDDYRLVQMCATKTDKGLDVDYTFDKEYKFLDLRVELPADKLELPSISGISFPAFLYENELHDLFGIKISGIAIDFAGKFYRKDEEAPFNNNTEIQEK
ncbi:MAG: NADH-quinone oxidoreductase subunit C [Victivallales bacterium]|nr:NADH-quinone oxidoreductase subunit C [Victivallales bacterium]MCF7888538.1 NADH-quinone oxidoreductase subunit C [Victivallales bacterium]